MDMTNTIRTKPIRDEIIFKALGKWLRENYECTLKPCCESDMTNFGAVRLEYTCSCFKDILDEAEKEYNAHLEKISSDGYVSPHLMLVDIEESSAHTESSRFVWAMWDYIKIMGHHTKFTNFYRERQDAGKTSTGEEQDSDSK